MRIAGNILVIALGAIMKFAVRVDAQSFDIHTVGVILMLAGAVSLGITLSFMRRQSRIAERPGPWPVSSHGNVTEERRVVYHDGPTTHYDGPEMPYDPDPF